MLIVDLSALAMGEVASELLASGAPATVMGLTSRGAFLRLGQGVIFLSTEPYRGPLTVNLVAGLPHGLQTGVEVRLEVILCEREAYPTLGPTPNPSLKGGELVPPPFREGGRGVGPGVGRGVGPGVGPRLSQMIELVLAARPDGEASDLLREHSCIHGPIHGWDHAWDSSDLLPLLGRGEGLTPWGDDLIIGLLLALYTLQPDVKFDLLADELTSAAFTRTSLLSANLIACAARGQADERLLLALNAILAGEPAVEAGAGCLLGWGNTSGVAALAGMAIGICGLEDR